MTRREDWPERLNAYIDARRCTPFHWGGHDCVSFAAGAVEAMTGVDHLADFRDADGRLAWGSRETAKAIMHGFGDLSHAVMTRLGEPIDAHLARRGDVLLLWMDDRKHALGVCCGHLAVGPGRQGLEWLPMAAAELAWRVGDN